MNKKIAVVLLSCGLFGFMGFQVNANKKIFDTTYTFEYAEVKMPSGEAKCGEVESWNDYKDSDMVQVWFKDGSSYYTHGSNVVFVHKKG